MKPITDFLDKLIGEYHSLSVIVDSQYPSTVNDFNRSFARWTLSARQVLKNSNLEPFLKEFNSYEGAASWQLPHLVGVLESARECLHGGMIGKLRHLLHAEMFDSLTAQAKELRKNGHLTPAAVLARIVLERWLRDEGDKAGIVDWETAKASVLNESLKAAKVFTIPKWRQIQALLDVGNAAAHGKQSEFTADDVQRMIDFAESNCV